MLLASLPILQAKSPQNSSKVLAGQVPKEQSERQKEDPRAEQARMESSGHMGMSDQKGYRQDHEADT